MSLRFLEDAVSAFRAGNALAMMLWMGPKKVEELAEVRRELHKRVMKLATETLALPPDPEKYFRWRGGREKGRVRGPVESGAKYFSIKRRRKRDWNEILRVWPQED